MKYDLIKDCVSTKKVNLPFLVWAQIKCSRRLMVLRTTSQRVGSLPGALLSNGSLDIIDSGFPLPPRGPGIAANRAQESPNRPPRALPGALGPLRA